MTKHTPQAADRPQRRTLRGLLTIALPLLLMAATLPLPQAEAQTLGDAPLGLIVQTEPSDGNSFAATVAFPGACSSSSSDLDFWITDSPQRPAGSGQPATITSYAAQWTTAWNVGSVELAFTPIQTQPYIHLTCESSVAGQEYWSVPVPVLGDADGDGRSDQRETTEGSHPAYAQSTPDTDDDGDSQPNKGESEGVLVGQCSGAYGVVRWVCTFGDAGYSPPPGSGLRAVVTEPEVFIGEDGLVWVWDSICASGMQGDYADCKGPNSNYNADPSLYEGNFVSDGYGWRNLGNFNQTIEAPCADADSVHDNDVDGQLTYRLCTYNIVPAAGSYTSTPGPWQGDTDPSPDGPIVDPDGDGWHTAQELQHNANPFNAASTPDSDDDSDGCPNRSEGDPAEAGSYYVYDPDGTCNGANHTADPAPAGNRNGPVVVDGLGRIWTYNTLCAEAQGTKVAYCDPEWTVFDYLGILARNVEAYSICGDGSDYDTDTDGMPVLQICRDTYRVYPNGTIERTDRQEEPRNTDVFEGDPNMPLGGAPLAPWAWTYRGALQLVADLTNTTYNEAGERWSRELASIYTEIGAQPGAPDLAAAAAAAAQAFLDALLASAQDAGQEAQASADCATRIWTTWLDTLGFRMEAYVDDPNPGTQDALYRHVGNAATNGVQSSGDCIGGPTQTVVEALVEEYDGYVQGAANQTYQALLMVQGEADERLASVAPLIQALDAAVFELSTYLGSIVDTAAGKALNDAEAEAGSLEAAMQDFGVLPSPGDEQTPSSDDPEAVEQQRFQIPTAFLMLGLVIAAVYLIARRH